MTTSKASELFDKFFRNKDGKVVIYQFPNVPLILWILSSLVAMFTMGDRSMFASGFARFVLAIWAIQEIRSGESLSRRTLGVVVLLYTAYSVIIAIVA